MVTLASGQSDPFAIAVDANHVYWLNNNGGQDGEVMKAALDGQTPTLLAVSPGDVQDLTVGPTGAYWTDTYEGVWRVDLGGGTPTLFDPQATSQGIAIDSVNVYWTQSSSFGVVKQAPLLGGPITTLASQQADMAWRIAVDDQHAYWTRLGFGATAGSVVRASLTGGSPEVLASEQAFPWGIAVDGDSVYWTSSGTEDSSFSDGMVLKTALAGGQVIVLAADQRYPTGIAVDQTSVYWTNAYGGTVMRMPLQGGEATILAAQQHTPVDLAVDATSVYWANVGGSVQKVSK